MARLPDIKQYELDRKYTRWTIFTTRIKMAWWMLFSKNVHAIRVKRDSDGEMRRIDSDSLNLTSVEVDELANNISYCIRTMTEANSDMNAQINAALKKES